MLIIRKVLDESLHKILCEKCDAQNGINYLSYFAGESEDYGETISKYLGFLQFTIKGSHAEIMNISSLPGVFDNEAIIILSRTAMEFIYSKCHISELLIKEGSAESILIDVLGFKPYPAAPDYFSIDLEKFYNSPCEYERAHTDI